MKIKDMFQAKIDREITGVIKVGQHDEAVKEEELKEYVVNVEKHFMGFMEGALDIKKQLEANKFRKIGMMNNKEFKNYLKNMEGDSIV